MSRSALVLAATLTFAVAAIASLYATHTAAPPVTPAATPRAAESRKPTAIPAPAAAPLAPTAPAPPAPAPLAPLEPVPPPPVPPPPVPPPPVPSARLVDPASPRPGDVLIDAWYGRYLGAHKVGWCHILGTKTAEGYEVVERYESRSHNALMNVVKFGRFTFHAVMDDELTVERVVLESEENGERSSRIVVSREGAVYTFATELEGRTTTRQCTVDAPVIGSNDLLLQRLKARGELVPGFRCMLREFDYGGARVNARELVASEQDGAVVCRFEVNRVTLDERGVVRLVETGGSRMVLESEQEACALPEEAPSFGDKLTIDRPIPHPRALEGATLEVEVEGYTGEPIFFDTEYQRVSYDRQTRLTRVAMRALPVPPGEYPELGFPTPDMEPFLRPDAIRQSDAPEIRAKALEIVGDERNSLLAVRRLAHWVHVYLRKEYTSVGDLTALTTLRERRGDCSEHALLFDSFARSLGIPVRQCSGYVFFDRMGGSHAWSQVWLGGRWLHVDCVTGHVGAGAHYILFWQQNATGEYDPAVGVRRAALGTHPVRLVRLTLTLNGREYGAAELARVAQRRGSWLIHPLLGVAVDLPPGWTHSASEDRLQLRRGREWAAISLQGNHPLAMLRMMAEDFDDRAPPRPALQVGGAPAWRSAGWGQALLVEHLGGSLVINSAMGQKALAELLPRLRFDLAALAGELDAAEAPK